MTTTLMTMSLYQNITVQGLKCKILNKQRIHYYIRVD